MRRIQRQLLVIFLFAAAAMAQTAQVQLKEGEFQSRSLGHTMKYRILLPASYAQGSQKYTVLYLLHGLYGNYKDWTERTAIQKYAEGTNLIIVMPDANDSWYTNYATDPQAKYEDYIINDLRSEIEGRYRTTASRDTRYIAGLSMGGYGALKFGLKYPQLFSLAASFSGALDAPLHLDRKQPLFAWQLRRVYGPQDSKTRKDNDIFELISQAEPNAIPYLYLDCGTADDFLGINREFVAGLPARHFRYEYQERPGKHDWTFWDHSVHMLLRDVIPNLSH